MKQIEHKTIILYGGKSTEHDISIITALQIYKLFGLKKNEFELVYIDRLNNFYIGEGLDKYETYKNFNSKKFTKVIINFENAFFYYKTGKKTKELFKIDFVINCCHGGFGEDGKLSSLLEFAQIPSSTGDCKSLLVSMDKLLTKHICLANDIKTVDFFCVNKFDFEKNEDIIFQQVEQFKFPIIVKPRSQGSSVGVKMVKDYKEFVDALNLAFKFDNDCLIERAITNKREFNCCCYKNSKNVIEAKIDEPIANDEILTFDDKYLKNENGDFYTKVRVKESCFFNGLQNSKRNSETNIPLKTKEYIVKQSKDLYNLLDLNGIVRFDFLFDTKLSTIFLCEINAIPGSLGYYFFDNSELINEVIEASKKYWNKKFLVSIEDAPQIFKH